MERTWRKTVQITDSWHPEKIRSRNISKIMLISNFYSILKRVIVTWACHWPIITIKVGRAWQKWGQSKVIQGLQWRMLCCFKQTKDTVPDLTIVAFLETNQDSERCKAIWFGDGLSKTSISGQKIIIFRWNHLVRHLYFYVKKWIDLKPKGGKYFPSCIFIRPLLFW